MWEDICTMFRYSPVPWVAIPVELTLVLSTLAILPYGCAQEYTRWRSKSPKRPRSKFDKFARWLPIPVVSVPLWFCATVFTIPIASYGCCFGVEEVHQERRVELSPDIWMPDHGGQQAVCVITMDGNEIIGVKGLDDSTVTIKGPTRHNQHSYLVIEGTLNLAASWNTSQQLQQQVGIDISTDGKVNVASGSVQECGAKGEKLNFDGCGIKLGNTPLEQALRSGYWKLPEQRGKSQSIPSTEHVPGSSVTVHKGYTITWDPGSGKQKTSCVITTDGDDIQFSNPSGGRTVSVSGPTGDYRSYLVVVGALNMVVSWSTSQRLQQRVGIDVTDDGRVAVASESVQKCGAKGEKLNFDGCRTKLGDVPLQTALRLGYWKRPAAGLQPRDSGLYSPLQPTPHPQSTAQSTSRTTSHAQSTSRTTSHAQSAPRTSPTLYTPSTSHTSSTLLPSQTGRPGSRLVEVFTFDNNDKLVKLESFELGSRQL